MLENIILAVGNYQEIWDRHLGSQFPRLDRNMKLNTNPFPLGPMLISNQNWDMPSLYCENE